MKAKELREKTAEELKTELHDMRREQFNLRMQQGVGQMSRPDQMRKVRRDIARVKTVLNELARAGNAS